MTQSWRGNLETRAHVIDAQPVPCVCVCVAVAMGCLFTAAVSLFLPPSVSLFASPLLAEITSKYPCELGCKRVCVRVLVCKSMSSWFLLCPLRVKSLKGVLFPSSDSYIIHFLVCWLKQKDRCYDLNTVRKKGTSTGSLLPSGEFCVR